MPARTFDRDTTTTDVIAGIDLRGKVAIITGASGGLGAETARALAACGATVVLAARDRGKMEAVVTMIREDTSDAVVEIEEVELADLASVRAAADRLRVRHPQIQLLIGNAGVMACPLARTPQGYESQFAINHLAHFVFVGRLMPSLLAAAPARIVCVSSAGHRFSPVVFDDLHFERRPYHKWEAYGQSKTANSLHAVGLERRVGGRGVHAFAVHPGTIMTDLSRHMVPEDLEFLQSRAPAGAMRFKQIPAGAATQVWAATAPELEGRGGLYLEDCQIAALKTADDQVGGVAAYAIDAEAAEGLWGVSEILVGERFSW
jgi:NAD(P)-dependent dehydrogenase (short-subunit alcohol dehydrogenase family)